MLDILGAGFKIFVSKNLLKGLKFQKLGLFTSVVLKKETVEIYGFKTEEELELFELLVDVSGIGPKKALAILDMFPPARLKTVVMGEHITLLDSVSGIGRKTAQKIVLSLKSKFSKGIKAKKVKASESDNLLIEALLGLGYASGAINKVIRKIPEKISLDKRVKMALKKLSQD